MPVVSFRPLIVAVAMSVMTAAEGHGQSIGIAAGPVIERGGTTGGLVQLSYFPTTAFRHVGLRFDGLYVAQPGTTVEGTTSTGQQASFQQPTNRTFAVLGAVSYRVGRGAVQPYALFGTGFYGRNSYSGGFTLGANAGMGADVRVGGLRLFAEARMHAFRGPTNVTWTTAERVRLIPVTIGLRF